MKLSLVLVASLHATAFSETSSSQLLAGFQQGHPDGNNAVAQLTKMMGAAQQKLSLVERMHGKTVKKVRKQAESFLEDEAKAYGNALSAYSAEVLQAEADLQAAVNVASAGLKVAAAVKPNPNDWKDPSVMEKAQLNAQVAATDRSGKRAEHQRKGALREAEERSEESIETEGQKLGMKLGDMTPLVNKAKASLEAQVEKASAVPTPSKATAAAAPKSVNLKSLQTDLAKAVPKEQVAAAAAQKKLDGFLTKADKDISDKRAKIEDGLKTSQQQEITKVLGAPVAVAAAKPAKAKVALLKQDPCAGCTEGLSESYQKCAMQHGNPCAETNSAGLVTSGPGTKKDIGCCMKKEKHDRCLKCSAMDCAHGTCKVNKKYYNQRTIGEGPLDDKKAMKKAGWGK